MVTPVSRDVLGSNILSRSRYDLFVDGNIHLCTVATDEAKGHKLKQSAIKQNANLINLGEGVVWEGGDMKDREEDIR